MSPRAVSIFHARMIALRFVMVLAATATLLSLVTLQMVERGGHDGSGSTGAASGMSAAASLTSSDRGAGEREDCLGPCELDCALDHLVAAAECITAVAPASVVVAGGEAIGPTVSAVRRETVPTLPLGPPTMPTLEELSISRV